MSNKQLVIAKQEIVLNDVLNNTDQENLVTTDIVKDSFKNDEFVPIIVAAPYGYGKSVYSMKVLAEVHAENGKRDFSIETIGKYLKFRPDHVIDLWLSIQDKKEVLFVWDDAGYWLNALSWNHPWTKAIQKYYNVVRTDWAAMIFSTPTFSWIVKKIREMENMLYVEIHKTYTSPIKIEIENPKPTTRIALGFNYSDLRRDMYSPPRYIDVFDIMLPNSLYKWYYPLRRMYAKQAKLLVKAELENVREMQLGEY